MHTGDIALDDARALVTRAIDNAEDIGVRGAVAVVGGSGVLVSASRMDRGGTGGMARARSKAWIAATQQMPSVVHLGRMSTLPAPMVTGFAACSPEAAAGRPRRAHQLCGGRRSQRRDRARGASRGPTPLHSAIASLIAGLEAGWKD